jgi:hypothetical protein
MHFMATTKNQPLAHFTSAILVQAHSCLTCVQPCHIPGPVNIEADALSCYRSWTLSRDARLMDVSNFPSAVKATIRASRTKLVKANQGHIHNSNDKYIDSQSKFLAGWLESQGHTKQTVAWLISL